MKKKVLKLTPALLKRIIREEKEKLEALGLIKEDKKVNKENPISELQKLKEQQRAVLKLYKKLHERRNNIKKQILKRL